MKKALMIVLSVILVVSASVCLFACNGKKDTVNGLLSEKELVVATNAAFEPFEYKTESGEYKGIDMDLAKEIAGVLGVSCKISDMEFDSVVASVASGTADIAMAGLTITEERKQSVDFTKPYFVSSQVVIAKKNDPILTKTTAAEVEAMLNGKKVGVQVGTTGYSYVSGDSDDYAGVTGANAVSLANGALAVDNLIGGQVDYVVIDKTPAKALVAAHSEQIEILDIVLTSEQYAFAVKKGNAVLLEKINAAIDTLIENGKFAQIFATYNTATEVGK